MEDFGPCESCGGDYQSGYCMSCYEKAEQRIKKLEKVIKDLEFCNGELSDSLRESGEKDAIIKELEDALYRIADEAIRKLEKGVKDE